MGHAHWIGPLRSNRQVTYGGEEIRVDALAERIDTTERNIENETYHIWTKKLSVSQLGDGKLIISEKETDEDDESNSGSTSLRTGSIHRPNT